GDARRQFGGVSLTATDCPIEVLRCALRIAGGGGRAFGAAPPGPTLLVMQPQAAFQRGGRTPLFVDRIKAAGCSGR
ncbi:hypothetical protein, partial [Tritonibacter mobilis]|uniref:hypothetical protein n=1 Tax=Tritonibacter mobilis TaxID=379347 RepID=UPI00195508B9